MSFQITLITLAQTATQTVAQPATTVATDKSWISAPTFAGILVIAVAAATFFALMKINNRISEATAWSLADALSEEVEIGTDKKDAAGNPVKDNNGNIAKDSVMKASSSRLIALLGTIAIMMLYIGGGLAVLYHFVLTDDVPKGTKDLSMFFVYGMVLFAPYVVNKFASIFSSIK